MSEFVSLSLGISEIGFAMCYIVNGMNILNWLGGRVHITYKERSDLIKSISIICVTGILPRAWGDTM